MIRTSLLFFTLLTFSAGTADAQRLASDPPSPREAVILRALAQSARFKFTGTPLDEVCDTIEKQHGILPMLDVKALDEIGISVDTQVTIAIRDVSLSAALDFILYSIDPSLTWGLNNEALVITTREAAEEDLQTLIYDVTALLNSNTYGPDFDAVIELITKTIEPDSWDEVGGPGSIAEYETNGRYALVVSQSPLTHRKIDSFLRTLYRFAGRRYPSAPPDANSKVDAGNWSAASGFGSIGNPRDLPMTRPRQSSQLRAAQSPRRFYSASQSPTVVIYAETK